MGGLLEGKLPLQGDRPLDSSFSAFSRERYPNAEPPSHRLCPPFRPLSHHHQRQKRDGGKIPAETVIHSCSLSAQRLAQDEKAAQSDLALPVNQKRLSHSWQSFCIQKLRQAPAGVPREKPCWHSAPFAAFDAGRSSRHFLSFPLENPSSLCYNTACPRRETLQDRGI